MATPGYHAVKRACDVAVSVTALCLLSPVLAGIGLAVRLDSPGPALFRQARLGKGGRQFLLLKFRTMVQDAEVVVGADNEVSNPVGDPRVTRVGRILRKTSVDELPQLLNVLKGDMSLVGPRPDLPIAIDMYTDEQRHKLDVLPGITGLAQVSGRNQLSAEERWDLDADYARGVTLKNDLSILIRTFSAVITARGVYKDA